MIILDQDLFSIEDFLSISVILRSLTTFYEDWQRIGFSRMLDWYHLGQLKMTSAHYWGLSVRIVLTIWEFLSSFWEGRPKKYDIVKEYWIKNLTLKNLHLHSYIVKLLYFIENKHRLHLYSSFRKYFHF